MEATLRPPGKCENPKCGRPIPDSYVLFRIGDKFVCETCFDTWLSKVKASKENKETCCPDCGEPMIYRERSNHHRNRYECTNDNCAVIEIKEGEIHRATMLKKELRKL